MRLFVGLGNPGPKYEGNRHNIGFMAADAIVRRHDFSPWRARFQGHAAEGELGAEKILLLKPATFMNESGRAVGEAMRFYKLNPHDVVVIYDELDLPLGKLRVKQGGGHGGHNGLRSIDAHIGTNYWRVRLGIGHPGDKAQVIGHVLGDFAKAEQRDVEALLDAVAAEAGFLAKSDPSRFMTKVALHLAPPPAPKAPPKAASKAEIPAPTPPDATPADQPVTGSLADQLKGWKGGA